MNNDLTQEYLKSILYYDPWTGLWTWIRESKRTWSGRRAGTLSLGYIRIRIDLKAYRSSRLAFLYMTGKWPDDEVDHINGIKNDDRWVNLREASRVENADNIGLISANTSGFKGVSYNKPMEKWQVHIRINGNERLSLGFHDTKEEAAEVYKQAALKYHGAYAKLE